MSISNKEKAPSSFDSPIGVLLMVVLMVGALIWQISTRKQETDAIVHKTSMVELDRKLFSDALVESCRLKGDELICDKEIIKIIMSGVDTTAVKMKDKSITLGKHGKYVSMPATLLANMIDNNLINDIQSE